MRIILAVGGLLLLAAGLAQAQDVPRGEFFGGYSYLRVNTDVDVVTQTTSSGVPTSTKTSVHMNLNGWNISGAINLNKWIGFVADGNGHYGTPSVTVGGATADLTTHVHSFVFGPRLYIPNSSRLTPFVQTLFGVSHATIKTPSTSTGQFSFDDNSFAGAFGGGLDVKLTENVSLRLVQADYFLTRFMARSQNNVRISAGVVFHFGKI